MDVKKLIESLRNWFYSDLNIVFTLKRGDKELLCKFESGVWYEHINRNGVTVKSIRHGGKHRRFVVLEGDDNLFEEVKDYCHKLYTLEETERVLKELAESFIIE